MKKHKLIIICFLLLSTIQLSAQSRTINGTVTDYNGKHLASVLVEFKNSKASTLTNNSGFFKIKFKANTTFVFSKRGFITEEIKVPPYGKFTLKLYPNTRKGKRARKRAMKKK